MAELAISERAGASGRRFSNGGSVIAHGVINESHVHEPVPGFSSKFLGLSWRYVLPACRCRRVPIVTALGRRAGCHRIGWLPSSKWLICSGRPRAGEFSVADRVGRGMWFQCRIELRNPASDAGLSPSISAQKGSVGVIRDASSPFVRRRCPDPSRDLLGFTSSAAPTGSGRESILTCAMALSPDKAQPPFGHGTPAMLRLSDRPSPRSRRA